MTYKKEEVILSLKDVGMSYNGKVVLRDVNLEIHNITSTNQVLGQVTTVLGKSGSGKSTLFRMIAGLLKPTTGEILIGSEQKPVQPGIVGMVLQTYPLFKHLTVKGNLELVCKEKDKIDHFLNEFDIADHKAKYPAQLSGGQRQRVAIVQQILSSNNFILLDEPFSGLDPVATDKLTENINKIANLDEHNTVLISSHIIEPALAISDSIWIIGNEYEVVENETELLGLKKERKIEGATIRYVQDLASAGLAWNPEIRKDRRFQDLVSEIQDTFKTL